MLFPQNPCKNTDRSLPCTYDSISYQEKPLLISNPVSFQVHGAKNMIRIITRFLRSLPKWVFKDTGAGFKTMLSFSSIVFLLAGPDVRAQTDECDYFVSWVEAAKETYQKTHRIYPVPARLKTQAIRYMPRLWVSPRSWRPIYFEDYLAKSILYRRSGGHVLTESPLADELAAMTFEEQCRTYLDSEEIASRSTAPVYVQFYRDKKPGDPSEKWTYVKYNLVFDWSGLPEELSRIGKAGVFLIRGDRMRWHRLDIHMAAILAFDASNRLRMLTLAQHNHQQTYLPGEDFSPDQRPRLVAAEGSNELYLDNGEEGAVSHRVVPFFDKVAYLIDPEQKPWLWAKDTTYGRNAGGIEIPLEPIFIKPKHPLADFSGLLGPPRRFFGIYTGQDGPPGFNYYAPPSYISLADFAAMGFWKEGDHGLLDEIGPLIDGPENTDWEGLVKVMERRLSEALQRN